MNRPFGVGTGALREPESSRSLAGTNLDDAEEAALEGYPALAILRIDAEPGPVAVDPERTLFLLTDMQRDFLEPGGFGDTLGNDVTLLFPVIAACQRVLATARLMGMLVIHTREGHRPDIVDAPPAKVERGAHR